MPKYFNIPYDINAADDKKRIAEEIEAAKERKRRRDLKEGNLLEYLTAVSESRSIGIFDNSALNTFMSCPRKFLYVHELCVQEKQESEAITVGSAVHEFMAAMWKGKEFKACMKEFLQYWERPEAHPVPMNIDHETIGRRGGQKYSKEWLYILLNVYYDRFMLANEPFTIMHDSKDEPYVEMGFALDLGDGIFTGKIDALVRNKHTGKIWIVDHKTTLRPLNDSFTQTFNPNNQFTGYMLAVKELLGEMPAGCIINAIRVAQLRTIDQGAMAEKMFSRLYTHRTPEQLDARAIQIRAHMKTIQMMRRMGPDAYYQNAPNACNTWGGCGFRGICLAHDVNVMESLVKSNYVHREWSPLPQPAIYDHSCGLGGVTRFLY